MGQESGERVSAEPRRLAEQAGREQGEERNALIVLLPMRRHLHLVLISMASTAFYRNAESEGGVFGCCLGAGDLLLGSRGGRRESVSCCQ